MFEEYDINTIVNVDFKNGEKKAFVVKRIYDNEGNHNGNYLRSLSPYASAENDIYPIDADKIDKIDKADSLICLEDIASDIVRNLRNVQQYLVDNCEEGLRIDDNEEHMLEIFSIIVGTLHDYYSSLAKTYPARYSHFWDIIKWTNPEEYPEVVLDSMWNILRKVDGKYDGKRYKKTC